MFSLVSKAILVTAVCTSAVAFNCEGQNFTLSPNDSIIASATFENLTVFNIQQNNSTTDTLNISWAKVSESLPALWTAGICDNGFCYTTLPNNGTMVPVYPTGYGLLSLHITPHTNSGTAIIRYAVWETINPSLKDTLTWIISSATTGINEVQGNSFNVLLLQNELVIENINMEFKSVRIVDVCGKLIKEITMNGNETKVDISNYSSGIYFIEAINNNKQFTKKIIINK